MQVGLDPLTKQLLLAKDGEPQMMRKTWDGNTTVTGYNRSSLRLEAYSSLNHYTTQLQAP